MGGIWILPTIVVPIVHMFAEHNQLSARHGLRSIHIEKEGVCRWTTGTTFSSEKLNKNRMKICRVSGIRNNFDLKGRTRYAYGTFRLGKANDIEQARTQ
jgi:hypothetical protein